MYTKSLSCLWEFLCMSCKESSQKIPNCKNLGTHTLMDVKHWWDFDSYMFTWLLWWCFNECHIDNHNAIIFAYAILCPHQWPSKWQMANPMMNGETLINYGTLCTCMSCNVLYMCWWVTLLSSPTKGSSMFLRQI